MFSSCLASKKRTRVLATLIGFDLKLSEADSDAVGHSECVLQKLSRTSLLLLEYKQHKAARVIQIAWRAYHARKELVKRWKAAITIQRWWRGFSVRHNFMRNIEKQLQQTVINYYNQAAIKIQALFRGWYVRQTVHDMKSLKKMQLSAAEELLSCIAYKLHHLLRTYSIPGIYSLRGNHCLSKVEKLLNSMTFRFHNYNVSYMHARQEYFIRSMRMHFKDNTIMTSVPYGGNNYNTQCKPHCELNFFATKDLDHRMYQIIKKYENTRGDSNLCNVQRNVLQRKLRKHLNERLKRLNSRKRDFCGDVINSMLKWKIWDITSLSISNDVLHTPGYLVRFLDEASKLIDDINAARGYMATEIDKSKG